MRLITTIIALGLSVSSFASDILEAKELHPTLHTIQFTLAELSGDFEMPDFSTFAPQTNYVQKVGNQQFSSADTQASDPSQAIITEIIKSNPDYTSVATLHLSPGDAFSDENGIVIGNWDSESDTLNISKLKLPEYEISNPVTMAISTMKWHAMYLSGKIKDGKEIRYCLLIKSYEPVK